MMCCSQWLGLDCLQCVQCVCLAGNTIKVGGIGEDGTSDSTFVHRK